jgi:hypothetical protein
VAEKIIERAKKDGADLPWKGSLPEKADLWRGKNPVGASWGSWKTWVLDSASQFRPGPPPDFSNDMQELKSFKLTPQAKARAFYYATQPFWLDLTHQKIFEYNLQSNPPKAARVYTLVSIAQFDATVACWEAKYSYWGIRPYEYDTTYKQQLGMPPFPGYPSGHAALSKAIATVLAYLFPQEAQYFHEKAEECAESRFEGGVHFRTDNVVGLDMGSKVGEQVVQRAKADQAEQ